MLSVDFFWIFWGREEGIHAITVGIVVVTFNFTNVHKISHFIDIHKSFEIRKKYMVCLAWLYFDQLFH